MEAMKRTATCGGLTKKDAAKNVVLNGWVHRLRNHGGIQFINMRDRYGITQVVIDQNAPAELKAVGAELKYEYCIAVSGVVRERPQDMVNPDMATGEIEVQANEIVVLSPCDTLPFMVDEASDAKEDLRLTYRYIDLRSKKMQENLRIRHVATLSVRNYLSSLGFYEIETPTFIRSTPEGARDFLVPSRLHPGKFYALPQSPQLFKQLLMVSGFDKYFQIARCYRDEDARGDRQPEFTQIDIEMSFVGREDVFQVVEGLMATMFRDAIGVELSTPFLRLSYEDAMNRYGSDKPDLRFGLEMQDVTSFAEASDFHAFKTVAANGGVVKALVASGCAEYSRKQIADLEEVAKIYKAKGLAWMKVTEAGFEGGVAKFFEPQAEAMKAALGAKPDDMILMVADMPKIACTSLGAVRSKLGNDLKLTGPGPDGRRRFAFAWIIDFPMFEWNEEEKKWDAAHHMFTMPQEQYLSTMEKDPGAVKGDLYDLVCNGYEVASGSIRIHDPEIQKRVFKIVGFSEEEAVKRFGFLLKAFRYGPPPHGGIAPGLDRLVMIMTGDSSIREVIAFPKNTVMASPMDDSPSEVDQKQLDELHIRLVDKPVQSL